MQIWQLNHCTADTGEAGGVEEIEPMRRRGALEYGGLAYM